MHPPPLLSFPPTDEPSYLPTPSPAKPLSLLYRSIRLIPLILIYAILSFGLYAYISLALVHLILSRRELAKGLAYGGTFLILGAGTSTSLTLAAFVQPGNPGQRTGIDLERDADDNDLEEDHRPLMAKLDEDEEDEIISNERFKPTTRKLVPRSEWSLHTDGTHGRELGAHRAGGMSLEDVLLDENNRDSPARIQLKSNGQPRFCRKVSCIFGTLLATSEERLTDFSSISVGS